MTKKKIQHLQWIYNRLKNVYHEDENTDYMQRFKRLIEDEIERLQDEIERLSAPLPDEVERAVKLIKSSYWGKKDLAIADLIRRLGRENATVHHINEKVNIDNANLQQRIEELEGGLDAALEGLERIRDRPLNSANVELWADETIKPIEEMT